MTQPTASTATPDRLAGLEHVIPDSLIRQVVQECNLHTSRRGPLTPNVVVWVLLAMSLFTDLSIRQVYKRSARYKHMPTPSRSAFCQARRRVGTAPLARLADAVVKPLADPASFPSAFLLGRRWVGIDGTTLDLPDTPANEAEFGRPTCTRGECAFPQLRKVSLVELATHAELAFVLQGCNATGGERAALTELLPKLPADALLSLDCGFFSFELVHSLCGMTVFLVRCPVSANWAVLKRLPDESFISEVYATEADRRAQQNAVKVRVIKYTLNDPQRTGHGEDHVLVTNMLDHEQVSAQALIVGYHERWEHELTFDEQKTHQNPRRVHKSAHLRSKTPEGVRQEVLALSLGHYVVRAMMAQAAKEAGVEPRRLSFVGCLQILVTRLPECEQTASGMSRWWHDLLSEMGQERVEARRERINPRVIKRKMSKWKKKRPHHRRVRPRCKPFAQTIVMR